ncbi:MAG: tRNA (guanosine(46)-N7)-methyltransferase TrmB [Legionellales bacterium]|nr:tRNA (guanosine(46)-N7)-methyltransferase TrmB [Legionellales bacterium]
MNKVFAMTTSTTPSYPLILTTGRLRARMTRAQKKIMNEGASPYLLELDGQPLDWGVLFSKQAPVLCEIGFGDGGCLAAVAQAHPDWNCLGMDLYMPGVASALIRLEKMQLNNVRIVHDDARLVFNCIQPGSVSRIHVLFSDPWPKARCHKRRLIQIDQMNSWLNALKPGGFLYIATDDSGYAEHIESCVNELEAIDRLNPQGSTNFMPHLKERPVTKYELRAQRLGHTVFEWCLQSSLD